MKAIRNNIKSVFRKFCQKLILKYVFRAFLLCLFKQKSLAEDLPNSILFSENHAFVFKIVLHLGHMDTWTPAMITIDYINENWLKIVYSKIWILNPTLLRKSSIYLYNIDYGSVKLITKTTVTWGVKIVINRDENMVWTALGLPESRCWANRMTSWATLISRRYRQPAMIINCCRTLIWSNRRATGRHGQLFCPSNWFWVDIGHVRVGSLEAQSSKERKKRHGQGLNLWHVC